MIIFTAILIAATCVLGWLGCKTIYMANEQETETVYRIAGSVLSQYPYAEDVLVDAVMNPLDNGKKQGEQIMSHYGYDNDAPLPSTYRKILTIYISCLVLILFLVLSYTFIFAGLIRRKKKIFDNNMLDILDKCLSEDYSFIEDEKILSTFDDSRFVDLLIKTAEKLKLKTDYLNEERDNTKSLVTDISHQLKTPISTMSSCFDMYVEADGEKEKAEFLTRSRMQIEKLKNLTASLVNISRLENKMITLNKEQITLTELLVNAVNTVYHKASAKDIELITEDFDDITLYMDKKWTAEAIANVLDNAVKYSPCKSAITIRIHKLFSFVRLEIEDEGPGIPKNEITYIFKRFFRGKNETVQQEEGSGIGLYLSRKILEEQNGSISVHTPAKRQQNKGAETCRTFGPGSVFILHLPLE